MSREKTERNLAMYNDRLIMSVVDRVAKYRVNSSVILRNDKRMEKREKEGKL